MRNIRGVSVEELEYDGRKWYQLSGTEYGTGYVFDNEMFGVCEDGTIVDSDGCPLSQGYTITAVKNVLEL